MELTKYYTFLLYIFLSVSVEAQRGSRPNKKIIIHYPNKVRSGDGMVSSRIFGGSYAQDAQFPYMVFHLFTLQKDFTKDAISCSASLIKQNWVLLAAHCFGEILNPDAAGSVVLAGKTDVKTYIEKRMNTNFNSEADPSERRAKDVFVNQQYNPADKTHDIALIWLLNEYVLDYNIQVIPVSLDRMASKKYCTIHGWGMSEGNKKTYKLMFAQATVIPIEEGCRHKEVGDFICLEKTNQGICQGDSGSPLICQGKVWGVASHLVAYDSNPECGEDLEEYYASVWHNLDWMEDTVGKEQQTNTEKMSSTSRGTGKGAYVRPSFKTITIVTFFILVFHKY